MQRTSRKWEESEFIIEIHNPYKIEREYGLHVPHNRTYRILLKERDNEKKDPQEECMFDLRETILCVYRRLNYKIV